MPTYGAIRRSGGRSSQPGPVWTAFTKKEKIGEKDCILVAGFGSIEYAGSESHALRGRLLKKKARNFWSGNDDFEKSGKKIQQGTS